MAIFPLSGVLRGVPPAKYQVYVSAQPLVRPCSEKKYLIYELDTQSFHRNIVDGHKLTTTVPIRLDDITFLYLSHNKHELTWISLNVYSHN